MMTLIEAKHYKCLRYVRQRLAPFQVLVGPNASGKSSFLDVMAFLGDLLREGVERAVENRSRSLRELVWRQQGDAFELAVELQIPDASVGQRNGHYRLCRYEVRVGADNRFGGVRLRAENFWLLRQPPKQASAPPRRVLFPH